MLKSLHKADAAHSADPPLLLTVAEVQRTLRVGQSTVYNMLATGALPRVKIGGRTLVPRAAVLAIAAGESATAA